MTDLDELVGRLRASGQRVTVARRAVLAGLLEGGDHLSAEDLAAQVQRRHPEVHLSTIYRALDALERAGIVTHVHLGHGRAAYHLADALHHHAVCQSCGRVLHVPLDLLDDVVARLAVEHGFVAEAHHFATVGRCARCALGGEAPEGHDREGAEREQQHRHGVEHGLHGSAATR